jgi:hypothetical protein
MEPGSTQTVGVLPLSDPRALELPLIDRLDVEFALVELPPAVPLPALAGFSEVPVAGSPPPPPGGTTVHLLKNGEALGRASFVRRLHVVADPAARLRRLVASDYAPACECVVAPEDAAPLASADFAPVAPAAGDERTLEWRGGEEAAPATATLLEASSDRLLFATEGGGGLLVDSDCFYPGWEARVDGREVPILRVDHALRGVVVPAGAHRVDLSYVPRPLILGLFLAPAALALLAFAALLARPRA